MLVLFAEEALKAGAEVAKAGADAMTGGGLVGGLMTAALGAYVIWDKVSRRRAEARKEDQAAREQDLRLDEMARKKIAAEYEALMSVRKAERDEQIARLEAGIAANKKRLEDLEGREQKCQTECAALRTECAALKKQNGEQAVEIAGLHAEVADLKGRLRAAGAIPNGTDLHVALPPR